MRRKPDSHEEVVTDLYDLVSKEFRGQTGIIYTITVKDADALSSDLRARGIKCGPYHASLEPETRYPCRSMLTNPSEWVLANRFDVNFGVSGSRFAGAKSTESGARESTKS